GTGENVRFEMLGNVMVWLTLLTVKLRSTDGAGLKLAFPAWSACTVQTPAPTSVIEAGLGPLPVHTDGVVVEKLTVRPELAVALTVIGVCSIVLLVMAPNVIVWFCFTTGRLTVTVSSLVVDAAFGFAAASCATPAAIDAMTVPLPVTDTVTV